MNRPVRPTHSTPPANRHTAAQKTPAQQHAKAPSAPPVYRPQPTPKVLQQKTSAKPFGVKPPYASQSNQRTPVNLFRQPQTPSRVLQGKPADAPRAVGTSPRQTPPHAHAHTQPRVLQPKMNVVREAPQGSPSRPSQPSFTSGIQRHAGSGVRPPLSQQQQQPREVGVVQLVRKGPKTKSYAKITRGTNTTQVQKVKKITSRRDTEGRVSNVRAGVRADGKVGRKSTTGHKTTDTSSPINQFLKKAKLLSRIVRMEGGHCVADVIGGSLCKSNTVPLPHAFNTIAYKKEETALKKTLPKKKCTMMEVSVEYPDDPLSGFLTPSEQKQLKKLVTPRQYEKLEEIFSYVPDFMAWEVNENGGQKWVEFRDIRRDMWPRGHRPAKVLTTDFVKAVRKL